MKDEAIALIKRKLGKIDLVIYSLASPRRIDPETGYSYFTVIRPIGSPVTTKSLDLFRAKIVEATLEPATEEQIRSTVKVMGGEDWQLWVERLDDAGLLKEGIQTVAFSYIGQEVTYPFYRHGTIGKAKEHLEATARHLNTMLCLRGGKAFISVNKALITRASAVIPAVPLYISILYKIMKEKGLHEGCIEQSYRLFRDYLLKEHPLLDSEGRIRLDDWELRNDVQEEVLAIWKEVTTRNLATLTDIDGVLNDFYQFFGFRLPSVDYSKNVDLGVRMN
ncbi:Enoyl-[acyl-carrier-protein] reductase [NADH] 1 [subsurface metagenome]